MTLKSYILGMKIGALLTFAAWVMVVVNVDPAETGLAGKILFFGSLFLFLSGFFILFLTWLRKKSSSAGEIGFIYLSASFRQGILLALLLTILTVMQGMRVLVWWDGALATAGIFLIELYFLSRR